MKLTRKDEVALMEMGHLEKDLAQLRMAAQKSDIEYEGEKISHKKAIELLGRHVYLTGISRCAFHASAIRQTPEGNVVYFSYKWW